MAAGTFAMESATYQTAALIDSGEDDYMLETAMLKVFATDVLWRIINDTIQIFGGKAYFTDEPYERMMRDARINMIGEGANDVLRGFIALVGMRDVGLELKGVLDALMNPLGNIRQARRLRRSAHRLDAQCADVQVRSAELQDDAARLGRLVGTFGAQVERPAAQVSGIGDGPPVSTGAAWPTSPPSCTSRRCVLNRLDALVRDPHADEGARSRRL